MSESRCCIPGCPGPAGSKDPDLVHQIPRGEGSLIRQEWLARIKSAGISIPLDEPDSSLCTLHFVDSDYVILDGGESSGVLIRFLNDDAVPSVFNIIGNQPSDSDQSELIQPNSTSSGPNQQKGVRFRSAQSMGIDNNDEANDKPASAKQSPASLNSSNNSSSSSGMPQVEVKTPLFWLNKHKIKKVLGSAFDGAPAANEPKEPECPYQSVHRIMTTTMMIFRLLNSYLQKQKASKFSCNSI